MLLTHDDDRLIACGAHHPELLLRDDDVYVLATRLQLMAIATPDQGRRLDGGDRLSDLLMRALIADAIETRTTGVLTAIVAQDNVRSLVLCERNGLRSQVRYDAQHARLTSLFERS